MPRIWLLRALGAALAASLVVWVGQPAKASYPIQGIPNTTGCIGNPISTAWATSSATTIDVLPSVANANYTIICGVFLWANGTTNVYFIYGTGATCGTGTFGVIGSATVPMNMVAASGFVDTAAFVVPAGNNFCVVNSAAVGITGSITYFTLP